MQEIENRMIQRMEDQVGQVKAELVAEKEAREVLEARGRELENSPPTMTDSVDKSQVVIGGFEDLERKPRNLCRIRILQAKRFNPMFSNTVGIRESARMQ